MSMNLIFFSCFLNIVGMSPNSIEFRISCRNENNNMVFVSTKGQNNQQREKNKNHTMKAKDVFFYLQNQVYKKEEETNRNSGRISVTSSNPTPSSFLSEEQFSQKINPVISICSQIMLSNQNSSVLLKNLTDALLQNQPIVDIRGQDYQSHKKELYETMKEILMRGSNPQSRNGRLNPCYLLDWFQLNPKWAKSQSFFKIYIAGVLIDTIEHLEAGIYVSLDYFNLLVQRIVFLQQIFVSRKEEFQIMRNLVTICSHLYTWTQTKEAPVNCYEYLLSRKIEFSSLQLNAQITDKSDKKYLSTLQKFGLVDPKFKEFLLDLLIDLSTNKNSNQSVIDHFNVILSLWERRIFQDYEQNIFQAFFPLVSDQSEEKSKIVTELLDLWIKRSKDDNFLLQNKSFFLSLGINDIIKKYLFNLYYSILIKRPNIDKKIFNLITLWNIKMNIVNHSQFLKEVFEKNIQSLTYQTQLSIHTIESEGSLIIINRILTEKFKDLTSNNRQSSKSPLVYEQFLGKNQKIYQIYSKYLIVALTGKNFEQLHFEKDEIITLSLANDKMKKVRDAVGLLLRKGVKINEKKDLKFLKNIIVLCSILETSKQPSLNRKEIYSNYLQYILGLQFEERIALIQYVLKVMLRCKNKVSTFVIFASILKNQMEDCDKANNTEFLRQISESLRNSQFRRVMTFTYEALELVILLYHWSPEKDKKHIEKIIYCWSPLCSKAELQTIIFQFDEHLLHRPAKFFGKSFPPSTTNSSLLCSTLQILMSILKSEKTKDAQYFCPNNNSLTFIPIREPSSKNSLIIKCTLFVNWNIHTNGNIQVYSSRKDDINREIIRHRICINNRQIFLLDRSTRQKLASTQMIDSLNDQIGINLQIKIMDSKLKILINDGELVNVDYPNLVDNIRFQMQGNMLIRNVCWSRFNSPFQIVDLTSSYQVFSGLMELKIAKVSSISLKNIHNRLNMGFLCAFFIELAKNIGKKINYNEFYIKAFNIVLAVKCSKQHQIKHIVPTFQFLLSLFQSQIEKMPQLPPIQESNKVFKSPVFHQLFLGSVMNLLFFSKIGVQKRSQIVSYLEELLFSQKVQYLLRFQNNSIELFVTVCKLITLTKNQEQAKFWEITQKIILTHLTNNYLQKKIQYIFYLSQSTQCIYLKTKFSEILHKILCLLMSDGKEENFHHKILAKYIISENLNLEIVFLMSNLQAKIKILDFLVSDKNLQQKCFALFKELPSEQLVQLSDWIFINCKRSMFEFIDCKKKSEETLMTMVYSVNLLLKLEETLQSEEEKREVLLIINKLMTCIKNTEYDDFDEVIDSLFSFMASEDFMRYFVRMLEAIDSDQVKNQSVSSIVQGFFPTIFKSPKKILLKCLISFRQNATAKSLKIALSVFQLDIILSLPLYSLNAFLQYCLELLIYSRQQLTMNQVEQVGTEILAFIECLIKNYSIVCTIKFPLLYIYPKLKRNINFTKEKKIKQMVTDIINKEYVELKGGVYFKLICLAWNLIEIFPNEDLTFLIQYLLEKICVKKVNKAAYRAVNDFIHVSVDTKLRSPIDAILKEIQKEHQDYFCDEDQSYEAIELQLTHTLSTNLSIPKSSDPDLTPFFVDFFLMKLCYFMQESVSSQQSKNKKYMKKYSQTIISYIKSFQLIFDEMSEKNCDSKITIQNVEEICSLIDQDDEVSVSQRVNSPKTNIQKFSQYDGKTEENPSSKFLQAQSKFLSPQKRKRSPSFDFNSGKKRRRDLISQLQSDMHNWAKVAKLKKLHRYFRDETKEIYIMYLMHQIFVSYSSNVAEQKMLTNKGKKLMQFYRQLQKIQEGYDMSFKIKQTKSIVKENEVRKVYPFTIDEIPIIKMKSSLFPNLANPMLKLSKLGNHSSKPMENSSPTEIIHNYTSNNQDIMDETTINNEQEDLQAPQIQINNLVYKLTDDFFEQTNNFCQLSYKKGVFFCQWEFKGHQVTFTTKASRVVKGQNNERLVKYGTPTCNIIEKEGKKIYLNLEDVAEVFYRKYNQVKNNSLQFFMKNGSCLYVILYNERRANQFMSLCKSQYDMFRQINVVKNFKKDFEDANYTEMWTNGELSNFDYLMLVNKFAGRSCYDLNQYFVFPWILQDYTSQQLNISNPHIYRDLTKPIGALNEQKLEKYLEKLQMHSTQLGPKYLYGSHYSTSLFLLYYLVRIQPFSTLHKEMQGGQFDSPDRLFSSMQQMWECLMSDSSTSDIKQAIPQFYYLPTFLKNTNALQLGQKQCGMGVGDVDLPPWANNHVDFILKMRACLQSDFVSLKLNHWIDLIFGKDQNSFQKHNVFYPLSYMENVNPQSIELNRLQATMNQIAFFGQNPYKLFTKEHPKKKLKTSNLNFLQHSADLMEKQLKNNRKIWLQHETLQMKYYVSQLIRKNILEAKIVISQICKNSSKQSLILNFQNAIHSLLRSIQNRDSKLKRAQSQNVSFESFSFNPEITAQVFDSEVTFIRKHKNANNVVQKIRFKYKFTKVIFNETLIVCYGGLGLRIYDWNSFQMWEYTSEQGSVQCCHLDGSVLFFTTSLGKLHVLDFFSNARSIIFQFQKPTYKMQMMAFPQPRLPNKLSKEIIITDEVSYKILIVGDLRKIVLMSYTHQIGACGQQCLSV